jgi:signal peptidase I
MEKKEAQKAEGTTFAKELYDIIEILVIAACVVLMLYSFVCRVCIVSGGSMDTTLADRQLLMVSNINYTPDTGDIIVFHQTTNESFGLNEPVVKRVIATAGQTIDIDFDTWTVTITDTDGSVSVLDESEYMYLKEGYTLLKSDFDYPMEIPEGYIFVMGDNRNHSTDSRSRWIGLVDERRVMGKAILRLTPFSKFGTLD